MTLNQRLKQFVSVSNLKPSQIASDIGASRQVVNGWINDGRSISNRMLELLLRAYNNLNARWLITGEGEMLGTELSAVQEGQAKYGDSRSPELKEAWMQCGALKLENTQLKERIAQLETGGQSLEGDGKKTRAG